MKPYKDKILTLVYEKYSYLTNYKLRTRRFAQFVFIEALYENKYYEIGRYNLNTGKLEIY